MLERFVYFDLGNVLVYFDHERAVTQLAELTQRPPDLVRRLVFASRLQDQYETGIINCDQFAGTLIDQLETPRQAHEILEAISAIFEPNVAMESVLDWLTRENVPFGILSNTCRAHWNWLQAKRWPVINGRFRHSVLSFEVKSMKPQENIYRHCEQLVGCEPSRIFFMDDRIENVEAAQRRGWAARQFRRVDELQSQLVKWLADTC